LCSKGFGPVPTRFYFSHKDESTPDGGTACIKVTELESDIKYGYYLWKAFRWLKGVRWPVP